MQTAIETLTIDVETTGLPPKGANYEVDFMKFPRVVEIGFKINAEETRDYIINQEGFIIPEEAIKIHGITNEMCAASSYFLADVIRDFINFVKGAKVVIGQNIYFDTSTIKANVLRLVVEGKLSVEVYNELVDILHKDKRFDTMRKGQAITGGKWPTLDELIMKLFNRSRKGHNVVADCDDAYAAYLELKKRGAA